MLYVSTTPKDNEEWHLWLEDMVQDAIVAGKGAYLPDAETPALCGREFDGLPFPGSVDPTLTAANRTWADSLVDLLNDARVCEECKTRAAVYYDVVDEVDLWAKTALLDECGACGETMTVEILGVKGTGLVQRRHVCLPEHHFVTEDEVRIPEEVE